MSLPELTPGKIVAGHYRIDRCIARGGIGEVWSATHVTSLRAVAIKRLLPGVAGFADVAQRFRQEGHLLGRIFSDFVVRLVEAPSDPIWGPLLVEELVEGAPLSQVLAERRFTVEEARELGFNLLRALTALERAGVVHCDLKPGNVILKPLGGGRRRPILIDFGAASRVGHPVRERGIGTFGYMAPEQFCAPDSIGFAVDRYAVGVILYRAVTGRRPFDEQGEELLRAKVMREAPPLESNRTDWTAQRLAEVVRSALRRDPRERYGSAEEMLTDLMALPRVAASAA
jgi:serine/threonine-protein kinase